jgi:hypothetical protein
LEIESPLAFLEVTQVIRHSQDSRLHMYEAMAKAWRWKSGKKGVQYSTLNT